METDSAGVHVVTVPAPTAEQLEDYEERAAILEFEAGLSRPEAERLAAEMCIPRPREQGQLFPVFDVGDVVIGSPASTTFRRPRRLFASLDDFSSVYRT